MADISNQTVQNLFQDGTFVATQELPNSLPSFWSNDLSQKDRDAILRQIHPIFLNTHSEEKAPTIQSNFDKFLNFLRLSLEWVLKLVDILVDAAIQIARLFVWVVAILGILVVVTLMTNTTDKFIDILNSSIFPIIGVKTTIQKVWPTTPVITIWTDTISQADTRVPASSPTGEIVPENTESNVLDIKKTKQELLRERRLREKNLQTVKITN